MTRESRLLLSLDEIAGLRWECKKCGLAVSHRLDQTIKFTQSCQSCNEPFLVDGSALAEFQQIEAFVPALKKTLAALRSKNIGATLTLELIDGAPV